MKLSPIAATLLAIAAGAALAAPGYAAEIDAPQKIVRYAELNLQTPEGVQVLYQRLNGAARNVCAAQDGRSLREQTAYRNCVSLSLDRAVRAVRNDAVLALHAAKQSAAQRS